VAQSQVISYIFDVNIASSLVALQERLLLDNKQLRKVVVTLTSMIRDRFDSNIGLQIDVLHKKLDLSVESLRACVMEACREAGVDDIFVLSLSSRDQMSVFTN